MGMEVGIVGKNRNQIGATGGEIFQILEAGFVGKACRRILVLPCCSPA
ncbi:hypothetical protein X735_14675 [Mesorhizobium sp. L2C085B000]|nr:hypothetical protein X735_14675 [Mesorhizobium sp. L2C085B000]